MNRKFSQLITKRFSVDLLCVLTNSLKPLDFSIENLKKVGTFQNKRALLRNNSRLFLNKVCQLFIG